MQLQNYLIEKKELSAVAVHHCHHQYHLQSAERELTRDRREDSCSTRADWCRQWGAEERREQGEEDRALKAVSEMLHSKYCQRFGRPRRQMMINCAKRLSALTRMREHGVCRERTLLSLCRRVGFDSWVVGQLSALKIVLTAGVVIWV